MNKVGTIVSKNSKQGGGMYVVIGHIPCSRCKTEIEEREIIVPSRKQKKGTTYNSQYTWCFNCGLYEPAKGSKTLVIK